LVQNSRNVSISRVPHVWCYWFCYPSWNDFSLVDKKFKIRTIYDEEIVLHPKTFNKGQIYGGLLFGLGWALTGACPGPLFAQIGTGTTVIAATLLSAIFGTWIYGYVREHLPH